MYYGKWITTPKSTPESSAVETEYEMVPGVIHKVVVYFPSGSAGTLHVQIFDGLHQVWPSFTGEAFRGDNTYIEFMERYDLPTEPATLTVKTWNDSTTYDHVVHVGFALLPKEKIEPSTTLLGKIAKLLGRL